MTRYLAGWVLAAGTTLLTGIWGGAFTAAVVWRGWWLLALLGMAPLALIVVAGMALAAYEKAYRRRIARTAVRIAARVRAEGTPGDREFARFMRAAGAGHLERITDGDRAGRP